MTSVLVTGGCGFIGANLAPKLIKAGYEVRILDNFSKGNRAFLEDASKYEIIEADIRDQASVVDALNGIDAVIHLAAFGSVVESVESPAENFSVNAEGTFKVLSAAREAGVSQVVFSSTGGALIGNANPPVSEDSVPRPISPYGASKLAGEGYCCAFAHSYDMSITALRFANVIGPISWHKKGAVTAFFKAIMSDSPIRIFGDGSATRDFLFVSDLCDGIVSALSAALPGFIPLHLAGGREVSVEELARLACSVSGADGHEIVFDLKRRGEVERNFADYSRAKATIGFEPRVRLEDAMQITWDWFKKHPERP
jgi:UDP-glucose 4-epimerase